ncbi:MAG: LacI family DNA-binding transcriptional regulator [Caldilineaceae bacterium]|nr:LacI family DNA-binding transcriptional regulator [Caldilineaceae bacterium]
MSRRRPKPTIHDVANAAQVSVPTVSRVLNNRYGVAPQTAARVQQAILELGYESSLAARGMRGARTDVIGLIMPDMDHSYAIEVIRGISRAVTGTKYDLLAMTCGRKLPEERGVWEQQQIQRLSGTIVDGIIVVVPDADEFRTDYPLVVVDPYRQSTACPSVIGANLEGAAAAMNYLTGLGHRRIGFVGGVRHLQSAERRYQGYTEALAALDIALDPDLVATGDFERDGGFMAAQQFFALDDPPTAVFAANDESALGVMDAAVAAGLRVPHDLSVIGFDNVPESAFSRPALTTVDQSISAMGEAAFDMLIQLIEGRPLESRIKRIPTQLIIRDSCGAPA